MSKISSLMSDFFIAYCRKWYRIVVKCTKLKALTPNSTFVEVENNQNQFKIEEGASRKEILCSKKAAVIQKNSN